MLLEKCGEFSDSWSLLSVGRSSLSSKGIVTLIEGNEFLCRIIGCPKNVSIQGLIRRSLSQEQYERNPGVTQWSEGVTLTSASSPMAPSLSALEDGLRIF